MTVVSGVRPVRTDVPWDQARRVAYRAAAPLPIADLPFSGAYGGRLAEPLHALIPLPRDDVAAMDGYAVAGRPPWRVVGQVLAGGLPHGGTLRSGTAVEIGTGAPVPIGAEAVLPYEAATGVDGVVIGEVEPGRHIRRRGEDCARGEPVLAAGTLVTPVVLGLAAALGHDLLGVRPRPVAEVLVTGDEVVPRGVPGPGRVRDAVGPMLPGLIAWAGGEHLPPVYLPDGETVLARALADGTGDVVIVCGASSRGPADHLRDVLAAFGATVLIDGVAVRPGHPQLLARLPDERLLIGLPGNPFAALAAALTLLAPVLRALAGRPEAMGESAALAVPIRSHPADTRLVAVRRSARGAVPTGHDRPGSLRGPALADALAVLPPGWDGGPVELLALPVEPGPSQ
ncbi:molybdopterin-binding protein [Acrocarpospora macrocephala]|uniref:Molybdopterin molybdenumtransferase n=1 Tax=Acrocarpospora macrocephala TaxID=150177 RepID=A0A5M3WD59_9ACTN|nr:molybdopterin molybdotransferase MoeA [Acrocarpospora macrocephala]GES06854.1 molybdopterin molybdenumtransferase MoeA [Acrocarpospora macrocephala]